MSKTLVRLSLLLCSFITISAFAEQRNPLEQHDVNATHTEAEYPEIPLIYFNAKNHKFERPFLFRRTLIDESQLQHAPRILGNQTGFKYSSHQDVVFTKGAMKNVDWFVFRPVENFKRDVYTTAEDGFVDKTSHRIQSVEKIAEVRFARYSSGISEMQIVNQIQEIRANDILVPKERITFIDLPNEKHADKNKVAVRGNLLGHVDGSLFAGLNDAVVIDRGHHDGVEVGDILNVIETQQVVVERDRQVASFLQPISGLFKKKETVELPHQNVAKLIVVKTYPHFSMALLKESQGPLARNKIVVNTVEG